MGVAIGFLASVLIALPDSYKIPEPIAGKPHSVATGNIDVEVVKNEELSVHFLELGNKYTGDCTFIKVDDVEVLIDAGSKASSIPTIKKYVDKYYTINIDHHISNTLFGDENYVDSDASATGEIVFDALKALKVKITPEIANNISYVKECVVYEGKFNGIEGICAGVFIEDEKMRSNRDQILADFRALNKRLEVYKPPP